MNFFFVHDISSMSKIIDRYEIHHADELEALDLAEKTRNYLPLKELLEIVQRLAQRHFYLPLLLMKNTFFFLFFWRIMNTASLKNQMSIMQVWIL
jgi:hypothetical protein